MSTITQLTGSQEPVQSTRARRKRPRKIARRANFIAPVRAVRDRIRQQASPSVRAVRTHTRYQESQRPSPSLRRPRAYASSETHTETNQRIPSSVTENEGRNDKIHFVCNIATVFCRTREDATSFVLHCGAAPLPQRSEHEQFSKLFITASLNGEGNELKIRSSPMTCDEEDFQPPWFRGKLRFRRMQQHGEESGVVVFVTADLCLNVNRALNHRRTELAQGGQNAILENTAPVQQGLCGNDNLAPFNLAEGEHDNARRACFTSVIDAIFADVERAAGAAEEAGSEMVQVTGPPEDFSLREVETCWDIGGAGFDAVQALADITPGLYERGGKRGWTGNANTVTTQYSRWERLTVYAKAPDRLRLEIRHYPQEGNLRYSASTIAGTLAKLDEFRQKGASRVNALLSFLGGRPAASRSAGEWEAYAMAWGACCGLSGPAKALFGILRQSGRIYGGNAIACIPGGAELVRKARDVGLLRNSDGAYRPVFPNAPDAVLTGLDSSGLIVGHESETQTVPSGIVNGSFSIPQSSWSGVPPSPP